jgi:two-component system chemotaxis response regulator CheB
MPHAPVTVLIVDDSALMRQLLTEVLQRDPGIRVVGTAADPLIAREKIKLLNPQVITLDIEMPRMDGLSFLERLMALRPMPVVVVSTLTQKGTDAALRALELGAVDVVAKPVAGIANGIADLQAELVAKVRAAARTRPRARGAAPERPPLKIDPLLSASGRIVAVGASTGGVEALQRLLTDLPVDSPAILVTQHMPPGFTTSFAKRLDEVCRMSVCEATHHQRVLPGHIYIANGRQHLELGRSGAQYFCRMQDGPPVSGHRPSVDVLFHSVASTAAANALGIILTGMGRDGAEGLLAMRHAGARTLGESEASCLIYGMSKAAHDIGAVETELALDRLAAEIVK